MSTIFWKNFLKCLPTTFSSPPFPLEQDDIHPTPPSTAAATASSPTINNIKSLDHSKSFGAAPSSNSSLFFSSTSSSDSDSDPDSPVDFAAIFASQRLFFSSPGRSNSIIESSDTVSPSLSPKSPLKGGVAVKKYSPDPYEDFKRSMQEMIEARKVKDLRADWDFLHELLSCYLTLNPKHTHKSIISAFADIVVTLLSSPSPESGSLRLEPQHRCQPEASPCHC